jgi:hypothetical protein
MDKEGRLAVYYKKQINLGIEKITVLLPQILIIGQAYVLMFTHSISSISCQTNNYRLDILGLVININSAKIKIYTLCIKPSYSVRSAVGCVRFLDFLT